MQIIQEHFNFKHSTAKELLHKFLLNQYSRNGRYATYKNKNCTKIKSEFYARSLSGLYKLIKSYYPKFRTRQYNRYVRELIREKQCIIRLCNDINKPVIKNRTLMAKDYIYFFDPNKSNENYGSIFNERIYTKEKLIKEFNEKIYKL